VTLVGWSWPERSPRTLAKPGDAGRNHGWQSAFGIWL